MQRKNWFRTSVAALNARLMYSCHDMTRFASLAQDGALPPGKRWKMRLHYLLCVWCRRYRRQLSFLRRAMRRSSEMIEQDTARPMPAEAKARLKRKLLNQLDRG